MITQEKIQNIFNALIENPACADDDGVIRISWLGKFWEFKPQKKEKKRTISEI